MKNKKHLTQEQRYTIYVLLQQNCSQSYIARVIGKHRSVVSREIKRNACPKTGKYNYKKAHKKALFQKQRFHRRRTFTVEKRDFIEAHLQKKWSPEQIIGYCRKHNIPMVSHETIYQYIREDKALGGKLYTLLHHKLKHRKRVVGKTGTTGIKDKISIDKRPHIVDLKIRLGDWEVDTIVGKNNKGAILTIVERKTGFLIAEKLEQGKNAKALAKALICALFPFKQHVHSITSDNGCEFAEHKQVTRRLDADFYFAHPYCSWQRGLNEYTNKLIREYIPKKISFDEYNNQEIKQIQYKINKRPRKLLNYETPKRIFFASL